MLSLLLLLAGSASAEVRDDYELTVACVTNAGEGWQLYGDREFAGTFANGHYTDPDPHTAVKDFWSDGRLAKLDRDGNGHFETVFKVAGKELVYAGSIGRKGTIVDAAEDYKNYLGQPVKLLLRNIAGNGTGLQAN